MNVLATVATHGRGVRRRLAGAALALGVGFALLAVAPAFASSRAGATDAAATQTASAAVLGRATTDNYKVFDDANATRQTATSLMIDAVTVDGTRYLVDQGKAPGTERGTPGPQQGGLPLKVATTGVSDTVMKVTTPPESELDPGCCWVPQYRVFTTGEFGPYIAINPSRFPDHPISLTLTVERNGAVIGSTTISYAHDAAVAVMRDDRTSPEYLGPGGRWSVAGTRTPLDWAAGLDITPTAVTADAASQLTVTPRDNSGLIVPRYSRPIALAWDQPGTGRPTSAPGVGPRTVSASLPAGSFGVTASSICDLKCTPTGRATIQATPPAAGCSLYASPTGSDTNSGASPTTALASPVTLMNRLAPGGVGCLEDGANFVLGGGAGIFSGGGQNGAPKTIRPTTEGRRARITVSTGMLLDVASHDIVMRDLDIRSSGTTGSLLRVDGDRITMSGMDLTYPHNICLDVGIDSRTGTPAADAAEDFTFTHSRIHDCGSSYGPPRTRGDSGVHGAYLQFLRDGSDADPYSVVFSNNVVDHNHNRGVQLYPDVKNALITHNVLAENGANLNLGSEASAGVYSTGNLISDNILVDSTLDGLTPGGFLGDTAEVVGNYPTTYTPNNRVENNCISNSTYPGALYEGTHGYSRAGNVENRAPIFVDAANHDYRQRTDSPCLAMGLEKPPLEPAAPRPDALVGPAGAALVGGNRYNTDASGQTVSATVPRGTSSTFTVRLENDGSATDQWTAALSPSTGHAGINDVWTLAGSDVTTSLRDGNLRFDDVPAGGSRSLSARVTPSSSAQVGSVLTYYLHLYHRPIGTPVIKDVVAIRVTVGGEAVPQGPSVTSSTPSAGVVEVAFTSNGDGGRPITSYSVACSSSDGGAFGSRAGASSPIRVQNLTGGKSYRCRVRATNVNGTGSYGAYGATVQLPPPTTAPGPTVTSSTAGSGTMTVAFTPNGDGGSPVTSYSVACTSTDGGTFGSRAGTNSPVTVQNLSGGKTYRCRVRATNGIGTGSYGNYGAAVQLPRTAPPGPTVTSSTASAGAMTVAFAPNGDGGSPITSYTVACYGTDGGVNGSRAGTTSPITVPNLTRGKNYRCRVRATNAIGTGFYGAYGTTIAVP